MLEFRNPIPVITPLKHGDEHVEGYALYVRDGGTFENDIWAVVLDDGRILHFRSNELRYVGNATIGLARPVEPPQSKVAAASRRLAAKSKESRK